MVFVVDIDDTLIYSKCKNNIYEMIDKNQKLIEKINGLFDDGHQIILYTGRHWNHFIVTKQQLEEIKLKYHTLLMGKPVADYYIDDKSILPNKFLEMVI